MNSLLNFHELIYIKVVKQLQLNFHELIYIKVVKQLQVSWKLASVIHYLLVFLPVLSMTHITYYLSDLCEILHDNSSQNCVDYLW